MTATTTATFAAGQTLTARFMNDWDTVLTGTVTRRTAKRITLKMDDGKVVTVGALVDGEGNEFCFPLGRYSMAPIFRATETRPANVIAFA